MVVVKNRSIEGNQLVDLMESRIQGRTARNSLPAGWRLEWETFFSRRWENLKSVDPYLNEIFKTRKSVSALVIGLGVSRPNPLPNPHESTPSHLIRPQSYEMIEVASRLEVAKRLNGGTVDFYMQGFDLEQRICDILNTQKVVGIVPLIRDGEESDGLKSYVNEILPGARRKRVEPSRYDEAVVKELNKVSRIKGKSRDRFKSENLKPMYDNIWIVTVPRYYRDRMHAEVADVNTTDFPPESQDVISFHLGNKKILRDKPAVVNKLLHALRPGGISLTDQKINTEMWDPEHIDKIEIHKFGYRKKTD